MKWLKKKNQAGVCRRKKEGVENEKQENGNERKKSGIKLAASFWL